MATELVQDQKLHQLELKISYALRLGVIFSGLFIAIGWIWMLISHGVQLDSFSTYQAVSFKQSLQMAFLKKDYSWFVAGFGLSALVTLPLIRVFMTAFLFLKQKDFILAGIAFLVFATLIFSFFQGYEI